MTHQICFEWNLSYNALFGDLARKYKKHLIILQMTLSHKAVLNNVSMLLPNLPTFPIHKTVVPICLTPHWRLKQLFNIYYIISITLHVEECICVRV